MLNRRNLNYFFLFLAIVWEPLQNTFLSIDSKGRILVVITGLVFFFNILTSKRFRNYLLSTPLLLWFLWITYSIINSIYKGYQEELPFFYFSSISLFMPFVVMAITYFEITQNEIKTVKLLLLTFIIYSFLSFFLLNDFSTGGRQFLGNMGNVGPLNTMFIIFFASILFISNKLKTVSLTVLIAYTLIIILLSASRKAFGASLIMIAILILTQVQLTPKRIFALGILIILLFNVYTFILSNSVLGERLAEVEEKGKDFNTSQIKLFNFLGDRAVFYIDGWDVFKNEPFSGIGLRNYTHKTNSQYVIHSEYMTQIVEGGILGSIIFLLFNIWFIKKLLRILKFHGHRKKILILLGCFLAIIFINLTAWTYSFPQYFACFGVMIGYIKYYENRYSQNKRIILR